MLFNKFGVPIEEDFKTFCDKLDKNLSAELKRLTEAGASQTEIRAAIQYIETGICSTFSYRILRNAYDMKGHTINYTQKEEK